MWDRYFGRHGSYSFAEIGCPVVLCQKNVWLYSVGPCLPDVALRARSQQDFTAMTKAVPKAYRYPKTVYGFMVKAKFMMAYALQQFFLLCKRIQYEEADGKLLEDIPSKVSREDELAHFRKSRAIEEAVILIHSAREELEKKPDENNDFNIGNTCSKLGQISRLKGEWFEAIDWFEEAINLLNPLTSGACLQVEAQREISTAHFLLGEVYMARYRDLSQDEDRQNAIGNFNRSILFDHKTDGDSTLAEKRLRALNHGLSAD